MLHSPDIHRRPQVESDTVAFKLPAVVRLNFFDESRRKTFFSLSGSV
jgi:hypothetical protein